MTTKTTIHSLPPEILFLILTQLTRSDLSKAVLVSHSWFTFFSPHLWSQLQVRTQPEQPPRDYHPPKDYGRLKSWFLNLKRSILAGALAKNGHLVKKFVCGYYGAVGLLAEYGETCVGLEELVVGSEWDPDVPFVADTTFDLNPLLVVLQKGRSTKLRKIKLIGKLLDERHPDFGKLLEAIPESIENLELKKWDLLRNKRGYHFQVLYQQDQGENSNDEYVSNMEEIGLDATTSPRFPRLKRLALHSYGVDINKRTLEYILTHSPNLETIHIEDAYEPVPLEFLIQLLTRHCPRLQHLHVLRWGTLLDTELGLLLDVSKEGWKTLGLPRFCSSERYFGPLSTAALLRHAPTLENVRLDGSWRLPSHTMQQLLSSAPNLKRLDAICRDRSMTHDFNMDAQDIVNGSDWVCTGLESLKIRIGGIPRPDILTRRNGRPFDNHLHHGGISMMTSSRTIQHHVYTQLSRLTNLKQLILGHDDVDVEGGCREREAESEGEYYERKACIENGFQYECLEMTLESGMGVLGALKGLRKFEANAMAIGMRSFEERKGWEKWRNENWELLETDVRGMGYEVKKLKEYRDDFWFHLGYLSYY